MITALEYGAINPSDLQPQSNSQNLNRKQPPSSNGSFVPGGGIIFSSVSVSLPTPPNESQNFKNQQPSVPRPRRHSSFHPLQQEIEIEKFNEASLNILDESSQLRGETLEFLSHFSSSDDPDDLEYHHQQSKSNPTIQLQNEYKGYNDYQDFNGFNDYQDYNEKTTEYQKVKEQSSTPNDLETELFGSILSNSNNENTLDFNDTTIIENVNNSNGSQSVIRGQDVLLSDLSN